MLSQEEKSNIRERLIFENELKKELNWYEKKPESKQAWINSKISLLIIGSIISGLLIPWFQYSHKSMEWRRENQFNNYKSNINRKELFLKEFMTLSAFIAEAYEVAKNYDQETFNKKEIIKKLNEIQSKRFHQIATIHYLLIFIKNDRINDLFKEHTKRSVRLLKSLKQTVNLNNSDDKLLKTKREAWSEIDKQINGITSSNKKITDILYLEIERIKRKNEKLHML